MNAKIKKVITEMGKIEAKILELQAKHKELEQQRTELENSEIIALFRSVDVAPHELADFIRLYKAQGTASHTVEIGADDNNIKQEESDESENE